MAPLKIGTLCLPHGLLLAPMAGVADTSFREICRALGAEYTVSEMVSAKALCFEQRARGNAPVRTAALANITQKESPMAVQIFGREPQYMAEAARLIAEGSYRGAVQAAPPAAIDINMGCPVPKVVSNGEGSALMREPELAADIVRAVKDAVKIPVTVKIRAGFSNDNKNAPEMARMLEAAGADLICVHGRTRQQFYAPYSDNGIIAAVKRAVSIPVVGNGDLNSGADAIRMLEETDCDGLMIARGALGNPWLFAEVQAALAGREYEAPDVETRLAQALAHAADMVERKGARVGLPEARKHMVWYCKGLRGAAAARGALMQAESLEGVRLVFDELLAQNV
ncbi:MAG: tRNA dihydrouridine synthase DusB [Ruminococcaceae bacterium]|nr:tRNA dihydrouridine synthase DusB [Oscillospiraceae bacterium]